MSIYLLDREIGERAEEEGERAQVTLDEAKDRV